MAWADRNTFTEGDIKHLPVLTLLCEGQKYFLGNSEENQSLMWIMLPKFRLEFGSKASKFKMYFKVPLGHQCFSHLTKSSENNLSRNPLPTLSINYFPR